MKQIKLFLILTLSSISLLKAQFAPIGADWHIGIAGNVNGVESYFRLHNFQDTLIGNDTYSLISDYDFPDLYLNEYATYLTNINETVYYFYQGKKLKLFDLKAQIHDTLQLDLFLGYFLPTLDATITIDTITWLKNIISPEDSLKVFSFTIHTPNSYSNKGKYTDKLIHSLNNGDHNPNAFLIELIGQTTTPESFIYTRCYEDTTLKYKFYYAPNMPCDFSNVGLGSNRKKIRVALYPNPNMGWFKLEFEDINTKQISIYDSFGKQVYQKTELGRNAEINLEGLNKGLYFLNIQSSNGLYKEKILIE